MKKILTSAGLAAIGAVSLQAATPLDRSYYAPNPGLTSQDRTKMWSVSASLRGFYDDNYFAAPGKYIDAAGNTITPRSSFGFEFSPRAALNAKLEQTFIGLSYQYSLRWYEDRKKNSADHSHQADLDLEHSFSETLKLTAKDSFVISQEPTLLDPSLQTAPTTRRSNLDNLRNNADITMRADISRLFSTSFGYANTLYDYSQSGAGSYSALLDRMEHLAKVDFRWNALPTTVALIGYQYGIIDHSSKDSLSPVGPFVDPKTRDNRSHYIFAGVDQTFANQILASVRVGAQITEFPNALAGSQKDSTTPYADASLSYGYAQGSTVLVGVRHARNQTDVTYLNTLDQVTTTVYAMVNHQITPKLTGSLVGQLQNSEFQGGQYKQTDDLYLIGLNFNYQINQYWGAELGYNFDRLDSDLNVGGVGRGFTRNRVFLGLRASY